MSTSDLCQLIQFSYYVANCHDDCVYPVTLSGFVVVVILQSFQVFLLSGTDTLCSFRSYLYFQKFRFDFLWTQPSTECLLLSSNNL